MARRRSIFRQEAVDALQEADKEGAVLQLLPQWSRWAYWFVVAVVAAALAYAAAAWVGDYAEGPAVVRVDGSLDLTTTSGGVVTAVEVQPGQKVEAGQVLVRFHSGQEQQELARILLYPAEQATRESLAALRAERELAESRLAARSVTAPQPGIAVNLRARQGQSFAAGDVVATLIADEEATLTVVALVPGQFRPMLRRGLSMRLELEGYPHVYTTMPIDWIGHEAVGPSEVRRHLGQQVADAFELTGSQVLVRGRLPSRSFTFEKNTYRYYDGIPGRVGIRVRSMRMLLLLVPPLRELFEHG
jgi:biotin carboxyl carrier protein